MARIAGIVGIAVGLLLFPAQGAAEPKAVVELFTSQGCSSCVSADAFLAELVMRDDVVAISLHVDYWDYLGWRDTFGAAENTERQQRYAEAQGTRRVFTPQMIVNGVSSFVGSDRAGVEAAIAASSLAVPVTMHRGRGTIEIEVGESALATDAPITVRLVLLTSETQTEILRGENAGLTVSYYNVVRTMRPIDMWDGHAVSITLPASELMGHGIDACAVLVQRETPDGPGEIVGAAILSRW